MDPFHNILPAEVALQIFSYLDASTLANACLTSSMWNALASTPNLWTRHKHTMYIIIYFTT